LKYLEVKVGIYKRETKTRDIILDEMLAREECWRRKEFVSEKTTGEKCLKILEDLFVPGSSTRNMARSDIKRSLLERDIDSQGRFTYANAAFVDVTKMGGWLLAGLYAYSALQNTF